jgi:hypothetical protein
VHHSPKSSLVPTRGIRATRQSQVGHLGGVRAPARGAFGSSQSNGAHPGLGSMALADRKAGAGSQLLMKEDAPRGLYLVPPLIAPFGNRLNIPERVEQGRALTGDGRDQHLVAAIQDVIGRMADDFESAVGIADRIQLGELSSQVIVPGHE